jgi:two-component system, sensor histidine kinase and response regulator
MTISRINYSILLLPKTILFFLLLAPPFKLFAQQPTVDSLTIALKKHPKIDTIHINLLSELAYTYHTIAPDSTTNLAQRAYQLSQQLGYQKGIADALKHWAIGSYLISQFDEAITKNEEALSIYESLGDKKGCGAVLNNIAIIKHNQGSFEEALSYYKKSLAIRQQINDLVGVAGCYNNIGNTYSDQGNFSESLFYLFKGLRLREQINNPLGIANSLSNISNIYFYLGKYDASLSYSTRAIGIQESIGNKDGAIQALVAIGAVYDVQQKNAEALACFQKALRISTEMGNIHSVALCLNNIGDEYLSLDKVNEARQFYNKSLKLSQESGDIESIAISHNGIANTLILNNNPNAAIEHLLTSHQLSSSIGAKMVLMESAKNLGKAYEMLKNYKLSTFYLHKLIVYKDSLFNDEVTKKSQQLEFNFILDKKQREISLLEKDRAIQKEIADRRRLGNISLAAVLLLSIALAISLWNSSRKVRKSNSITLRQKEEISRQAKELQELITLKDKIFSVLSHDLRSPIASLSGIMTLMDQDMLSPEEFTKVKEGMNNQLAALGLLLDNLLYWSRSQINGHIIVRRDKINIIPIIQQNIQLLSESAHQKNISLVLANQPTDSVTAFADVNHADIVIRNLISNAIKFTNPEGKVEIEASVTNNTILIRVSDNGIGMEEKLASQLFTNKLQSNMGTSGEKGTGLGLLLCKDFAEQNDGKLSVTSKLGEGSTFYFTLPKA